MHKLSALLILLCLAPAHAQTLVGVTGEAGLNPETLFEIDPSDASSTFLMTFGNGEDGETIGFDPDDDLLYHASGRTTNQVWEKIDPWTLSVVATGPFTATGSTAEENTAIVHNPATGRFLVANFSSQFFDTTTVGVGTLIGSVPEKLKGLAFSGGVLYGVAQAGAELYRLNPANGSALSTAIMTYQATAIDGSNGLATHPDTGQLWLAFRFGETLDRHLGVVDPANGVITYVGAMDDFFAGIVFLPEPSTATGLAAGFAALLAAARRRRAHQPGR